jgi:hypothetical protein
MGQTSELMPHHAFVLYLLSTVSGGDGRNANDLPNPRGIHNRCSNTMGRFVACGIIQLETLQAPDHHNQNVTRAAAKILSVVFSERDLFSSHPGQNFFFV